MGLFIPAHTQVKKKIAFLKCEMNFGRIYYAENPFSQDTVENKQTTTQLQ